MKGKLIIFSAPSGSGKSTIIRYLLDKGLPLRFSISATSRAPRGEEQDGREYYFLTPDTFRQKIAAGEFLEYEEVYRDQFYGTLRSEIERIQASGNTVVLDVDVVGGCRIKEQYGAEALSVFIRPPSIDALRTRLEKRGTDAPEVIERRLEKATYELSFAPRFDRIIVNDDLEQAQREALKPVTDFIHSRGGGGRISF